MSTTDLSPPALMTPPVEPGEIPHPTSAWPKVIGVITIVFGALGILVYGCGGLIGNVIVVALSGAAQSGGAIDPVNAAQMDVLRQYMPWTILSGLGSLALGVLLLVAGIGLLRRRSWSRKASVVWSILRMTYAIPTGVLGYIVNTAQFEAMEQAAASSSSPIPSGFFAIMHSLGPAGLGCGLVWGWALPVFLLSWFSRSKIKAEVAQWTQG